MRTLLFFPLLMVIFVSGCNKPHLDIFPPLADPALMHQPLTVTQMHQDMDAFVDGVIARHPDLAAYTDKEALKAAVENYKRDITGPLTRTEFYRIIGRINHHLNDGHALLLWPYQEYQSLQEQGKGFFPFDVRITRDGDIFLKHSYSHATQSWSAGDQITRINGVPVAQILETLQQYAGGETRYLREQFIAQRFGLALWATLGWIDHFSVEMVSTQQQQSFSIEPGQDWQEQHTADHNAPHYYKQLNDKTGLLYLAHFDIDPDEFERFIDDSFARMRQQGVQALIIDIRDNPGGNTDTVTYLSRHLADKPFRLVSAMREKLNADNRGWFNYKGEVGEIITREWDDWEKPVAPSRRFDGDVYLLIGPVSYSAAIVLATTLKDNEFATLIGETTGGFANQTAQGNLFNLPHSQLRAYVATRTLVRPNGDTRRQGVQPHHVAYRSLSDIKANRDTGMQLALELIRSKQVNER